MLVFIKLTAGLVGNSFAIIADAIESAGDVFSSFIIYLGLRVSDRPSDEDHPLVMVKLSQLLVF